MALAAEEMRRVSSYGGSVEYALIRSLRFSDETSRKPRPQAPISVTPEPDHEANGKCWLMQHRQATRQWVN
jgi:hypothetical protein